MAILKISIAATLLVAALGISLGLASHSVSILFDGMYALIDASMSVLALIVARLIAKDNEGEIRSRRFLMGFWHLEPMVLAFNGILLVAVSVYALFNAIGLLLNGGNNPEFGWAVVYAAAVVLVSLAMVLYQRRVNRTLKSAFIALDLCAWMMAGGISAALLVAFSIGLLIKGTAYEGWMPFVDPLVLALVCMVIIPMPYASIRQAISDIMLMAPDDLKERVDGVAQTTATRYGFTGFTSYVAKVGRSKEIELCFVLPVERNTLSVAICDMIRDEVGSAIGDEGPDRWLTISFTTNPKWSV